MTTNAFMIGMVSFPGSGRSTTAGILASYLWHYYPNFKIAVWDLDEQLSMYHDRAKDIFLIKELKKKLSENSLKRHKSLSDCVTIFETAEAKSPLFPIRPCFTGSQEHFENVMKNPENLIQYLRIEDIEKYDYTEKDIILVDFPSRFPYVSAISNLLLKQNALIMSVGCDLNMWAGVEKDYCQNLQQFLSDKDCNFKDNIHILWSFAPRSLYKRFPGESDIDWIRAKENIKKMQAKKHFPFPSFETVLPKSVVLKDSIFRTILPVAKDKIATKSVESLIHEILTKVIR